MPDLSHLTPEQLETLRHMLGINTPTDREPAPYRDYYCANQGDLYLMELERLGLVECYRRSGGDTPYDWYKTTDAGRAAAIASHATIRRPKPQRVYSRFLDVRDAIADLTFHQFLTDPLFTETRRAA